MTVQCEAYNCNIDVHYMTVLEDKVYLYGEKKETCLLSCAPLTDLTSWSELSLPLDYDVRYSALTTYQSQLILLGGRKSRKEFTNKVWASDDGHNWQQSFPPMSRCRCWPLAVSCANPECLIVVGGDSTDITMEIFFRGEWMSVQDLPEALRSYSCIEGIIHNGSLHLYYLYEQGIHYCWVESLLAGATQVGWRSIKCPPHCYYHINYSFSRFSLFSFEQQLLATNEELIFFYSPNMQSWVHLSDNPAFERSLCAVTVRDYVLITTCTENYLYKLKATGKVCI